MQEPTCKSGQNSQLIVLPQIGRPSPVWTSFVNCNDRSARANMAGAVSGACLQHSVFLLGCIRFSIPSTECFLQQLHLSARLRNSTFASSTSRTTLTVAGLHTAWLPMMASGIFAHGMFALGIFTTFGGALRSGGENLDTETKQLCR
jgi:hypothetical protein